MMMTMMMMMVIIAGVAVSRSMTLYSTACGLQKKIMVATALYTASRGHVVPGGLWRRDYRTV